MRRIATLSLILGLASCGLAACGGSAGSSAETGTSHDLSGTVTIWDLAYHSGFAGYDPLVNHLDSEFEEMHPGVTVDRVGQPYEGYEAIYRAAFAAHEGPDIMETLPGPVSVLGFTQGLEPLNNLVKPELQKALTGWAGVTPGFTETGERYGVPIGTSGFVVYYNKKMFKEAGLPSEFAPQTWEEVVNAGKRLKAAGFQPFTGGNKEGYENDWWFSVGWQTANSQEQAVELAEGNMSFEDEAVAKAFEPEFMMQEAGLYPADRFSTPLFGEGTTAFGEEKGAMFLGRQSSAESYREWPQLDEKNIGVFLPPGSAYSGEQVEYVWSVPKFAKNKAAAAAFIEFLASKKGQQTFVDRLGMLPNRPDVNLPADAPNLARTMLRLTHEVNGELDSVLPSAEAMIPLSVLTPMQAEINQALQGRTTLAAAQKAMQEASEAGSS